MVQINPKFKFLSDFYERFKVEFSTEDYPSAKSALSDVIDDRHFGEVYDLYFENKNPNSSLLS